MRYDHTHFNAQRAYGGAINERIGNFLPMVRKLAWYYEGSGGAAVDVDDLIQAGMIALTECAQRRTGRAKTALPLMRKCACAER